METDEKLIALKKAYADIILSISKEAAARVMASEKKSNRYQHELKVTKDEGVRMLMRLKQMMDYQVCEANAASLKQQKKIEELEAQLYEAEDIVKDLREELENVRAELGRIKSENLQCVKEPVLCPSQINECGKCHYKLVCSCSSYIGNRDLPNIILRGKEPGQYRNGCTHRILACERNLLDRDSCLSEEADEIKDNQNDREHESGHRKLPDTADPQSKLDLVKSSEKENSCLDTCYEKTMCKDEVHEKMVTLRTESGFSDCLGSSDCKLDVEKVDLPTEGLAPNLSDITNGVSSQPMKERVIKFTFQRKRKRQLLSDTEVNASLETEKKKDAKKSDKKMEQVKPILSMESSRESRRLLQVARQLISLSEKKRWD